MSWKKSVAKPPEPVSLPLMCRSQPANTHKLAGQGMGTFAFRVFRVFAPSDLDQLLNPPVNTGPFNLAPQDQKLPLMLPLGQGT